MASILADLAALEDQIGRGLHRDLAARVARDVVAFEDDVAVLLQRDARVPRLNHELFVRVDDELLTDADRALLADRDRLPARDAHAFVAGHRLGPPSTDRNRQIAP